MSETTTPQDRLPAAEEAFAERVAPLLELVERWRARIVSEAQGWPTVRRAASSLSSRRSPADTTGRT